MDLITPDEFDNKYYVGLTNNLGLFTSDAALLTNATMKALVDSFARSEATWKSKFARSMLKMGQIGVLSGTQGEIRLNCRVINPLNATAIDQSGSSGFTGVAAS
jgi:peroxidase